MARNEEVMNMSCSFSVAQLAAVIPMNVKVGAKQTPIRNRRPTIAQKPKLKQIESENNNNKNS